MKTEDQLRREMRNTPAGQFLWSMGRDYYDTESAARRVAEEAAERIAAMTPAAQACHGLDLPPGIPAGAVAALVAAARTLADDFEREAKHCSGGYTYAIRAALAPFTTDPAPVSRDFPVILCGDPGHAAAQAQAIARFTRKAPGWSLADCDRTSAADDILNPL